MARGKHDRSSRRPTREGGSSGQPPEIWTAWLGAVDYRAGLAAQERMRAKVESGELPGVLLLQEHPPVYTLGRRSEPADLPFGPEHWAERNIDVVKVDRGGKLTYHGPGQLVAYPIVRTSDVVGFVRTIEHAVVAALRDEGIEAAPREGLTGVWVEDRKIGSIGLHLARGVTTHGVAINVDADLAPFGWVTPCGLPGVTMTSIALETGRAGGMTCFRKRLAHRFCEAAGVRQRVVTAHRLGLDDLVGAELRAPIALELA
jgi:lipoyl(octanoyl) transferase